MKDKIEKSEIKKELRALRKKAKRIEDSRSLIKLKNREKGKLIKIHQDRQLELENNRDQWKEKCAKEKTQNIHFLENYNHLATRIKLKEDQIKQILKEFSEIKECFPKKISN